MLLTWLEVTQSSLKMGLLSQKQGLSRPEVPDFDPGWESVRSAGHGGYRKAQFSSFAIRRSVEHLDFDPGENGDSYRKLWKVGITQSMLRPSNAVVIRLAF